MIEKKNVLELLNLPKEVKFCKNCTISNQRPRISFDDKGICSACNFAVAKRNTDWEKRETELKKLCDKFRKNNGEYDVIVPCSGGKDGSYVAHQLKTVYGMTPLAVTWAPCIYTEIGRKNLNNFIESGFNHVLGTSDPTITKKIASLAFRELGDPFQPFIYGQQNFPLRMAHAYDVKLVMYGENGEVEYGGDMKNANSPTRTLDDHDKYYYKGMTIESLKKYNILLNELYTFSGPTKKEMSDKGTEIHFFSYYKFWDAQENFYYAQKNCNFEVNDERSEGTYSKYASLDDKLDGFHYYMMFVKLGIGRATSDAAHEIRDNKIDREEGKALIKRYDGEFPKKHFDTFLHYCDIDEKTFFEIVDSWRPEHIWEKQKNEWSLKNPIWK